MERYSGSGVSRGWGQKREEREERVGRCALILILLAEEEERPIVRWPAVVLDPLRSPAPGAPPLGARTILLTLTRARPCLPDFTFGLGMPATPNNPD
jgi:hypothetical protein